MGIVKAKTGPPSTTPHLMKPNPRIWRYVKDGGVSDGNDCGWVDQVEVWGDWGEWWIEIQ